MKVYTIENLQEITGLTGNDMQMVSDIHRKVTVASLIKHAMKLRHPTAWKEAWEHHITQSYHAANSAVQAVGDPPDIKELSIEFLITRFVAGNVALGTLHEPIVLSKTAQKELEYLHTTLRLWEALPDLLGDIFFTVHLGQMCLDELSRRLVDNPHTYEMLALRDRMDEIIGKSIQEQMRKALTERLMKATRNIPLPFDGEVEKESFIGESIVELNQKLSDKNLRELIVEAVEGNLKYFPRSVYKRMFNIRKKQLRQEKYHEGELVRLDDTKEGVQISELLVGKYDTLQTQPQEIDEGISQEQRKLLEALLGENGLRIFEYRHQHPGAVGTRGERKEIAGALGIAGSTVAEYIGSKKRDGTKRIGTLEQKSKKILEIFS